ncbi:MAG: SDR family oxidoreductase [Candidatus Adiutrix sp.]|jgi:NAD(P)-dependent dehydrogenase (short-subunit alcohol dehydrogenase family)|nr:SDR family oxidoreductase [Candidatus Adiutrix sp.]
MDFKNKTAVIVGGGGGLGLATALEFARAGASLVIMDGDQKKLEAAGAVLAGQKIPPPALSLRLDVSSAAAVAEAFRLVDQAALAVNFLINAAGLREVKMVYDLSPEEFQRVVNVNLCGVYYCCREAALRMRSLGGGAMVTVASVAGLTGLPHRPAYCASKHGLVGLSRNLALDLGKDGIRVNVLAPGTIRTPMTEAYYSSRAFLDGLDELVPLGSQLGGSQDVARAAVFLCSEAAEFITGACLPVDGGWSAGKSYAIGQSTPYTSAGSGSVGAVD